MPKKSPYKTLSSIKVWENPWYHLQQDVVRFPDGSEGTYTIVRRGGAVFILPILKDGRIVLIRNYRYTIGRWLWEIPAGGVEAGSTPLETAQNELREEIGGVNARFELIGTFYTMPGISDEYAHIFAAFGVELGEPEREASEVMELHIFSQDEVLKMVHNGDIEDGPSALSILLGLKIIKES